MRHIDAEIAADAVLRRRVETLLDEMRFEQRLVARRERDLEASARIVRQLDSKGTPASPTPGRSRALR